MKELICITCPRGCHLKIDDELNVTGNSCPRGQAYAKSEVTHPVRMITSTMKVDNGSVDRVSVKTESAVDKNLIFDIMKEMNQITLHAPIHRKDIAIENVCDTHVNVIVTKDVE